MIPYGKIFTILFQNFSSRHRYDPRVMFKFR